MGIDCGPPKVGISPEYHGEKERVEVLVRGSCTVDPGETQANVTHFRWGMETYQKNDAI